MKGKENISLFEQQPSTKPSSARTQFTFTCESDSAKSMVWPDPSPSSRVQKDSGFSSRSQPTQNDRGFATQGTQTSPNIANPVSQEASSVAAVHQPGLQQPRKPRRPLAKRYAIAARERRLRQEYNNYHHPPKDEDIWICQFCEYESIFGQPPQHLIRQYEAKDRRERKRLAEKRRLLEKAKMKGRKGKKGNKNSAKTQNATNQTQPQSQKPYSAQQSMQNQAMQNQDLPGEEHESADQAKDPNLVNTAVPSSQTPSKIPQPVKQNQVHSLRPPSGTGTMLRGSGTSQGTYF